MPADVEDLLIDARKLYRENKYDNALNAYNQALEYTIAIHGPEHSDCAMIAIEIGDIYRILQQHDHANSLYTLALSIVMNSDGPEHPNVGICLSKIGNLYISLGDYAKAQEFHEHSLNILEKTFGRDHPNVGKSLASLGNIYILLGDYEKACELLKRALLIQENAFGPGHPAVARCLNSLGSILYFLGDYEKAYDFLEQALKILEDTIGPEHRDVALCLSSLGSVLFSLGDYENAYDSSERAIIIIEKSQGPEHPDLASSLITLSKVTFFIGDYENAFNIGSRVLKILEKSFGPDHPDVARSLIELGNISSVIGKRENSFTFYSRALRIFENKFGLEHVDVARCLCGLGNIFISRCDYLKALDLHQQARKIFEMCFGPEHQDTATSLNNIGNIFFSLGEYEQARDLYERALKIFQNIFKPLHPYVATCLSNLGNVFCAESDYDKARDFYERALEIEEQFFGFEHKSIACCLLNLGKLVCSIGDFKKARSLIERALKILEQTVGPEHQEVAICTIALGYCYSLNNDKLLAQKMFKRSFEITHFSTEINSMVKATLYHYYSLHLSKEISKLNLAILYSKLSVCIIQKAKNHLEFFGQNLTQSFLKSKRVVYEHAAKLLILNERIIEAQQILNFIKEIEFCEFIRRGVPDDLYGNDIFRTSEESNYLQEFEKISESIVKYGIEYKNLKEKKRKQPLTEQEIILLDQLRTYSILSRKNYLHSLDKLEKFFFADNSLLNKSIPDELKCIDNYRQVLSGFSQRTVIVHTLITEDRLHIIFTTPETRVVREYPITYEKLVNKINEFRMVICEPRLDDPLPLAQELYDYIIRPVHSDLEQSKAESILLSLDGPLRYIPIAALHDGNQYLIENFSVVLLTEAGKTNFSPSSISSLMAIGLGTTEAYDNFPSLPGVKEELEIIIGEAPAILPGEIRLNKDFDLSALRGALEDFRYPIMHVATHFKFSPGCDNQSYLLLGDGSRLTVADLREQFEFEGVDFLTLSACETAVSTHQRGGREIEGLGGVAQQSGAKSVICTLWQVADKSSAKFMHLFYYHKYKRGQTKAEALRQAQISFILGEIDAKESEVLARGLMKLTRKTENIYSHPYFWAPYILMGCPY